jgi:Flp pilus assembly protein TadG
MHTRASTRRSPTSLRKVLRNHEKGAVFVETAFIFTVLVIMLLGIFDFGRILYVQQALAERARRAARYGAVNNPDDTTTITNRVLYNSSTVPANPSGYMGLTSSNVTVTHSGSGTENNRLTVKIQNVNYRTLTPFFPSSFAGPNIRVSQALGIFN